MPQAWQKCAAGFGPAYMPIAPHFAATKKDLSSSQRHKEGMGRAKRKKICSACGKELSQRGAAKGREYAKGPYEAMGEWALRRQRRKKGRALAMHNLLAPPAIGPMRFENAAPSPARGKSRRLAAWGGGAAPGQGRRRQSCLWGKRAPFLPHRRRLWDQRRIHALC